MSEIVSIPSYQPIPFPAPFVVLEVLLVLGFFLHLIPMNISLVGGFVSAICLFIGGENADSFYSRIGKQLAFSLPIFTSFAITQGIVPLLFIQLLYGPLFYTSSILMGSYWISIVFILIIAYYLLYIYKFNFKKLGAFAPWLLIAASLLFLVIAYIFTNNMTLMLQPEKWLELSKSTAGLALNHAEPQILPRLLHTIIGSIAVTGLAIGCFGLYLKTRKNAPEATLEVNDPLITGSDNPESYSTWLIKFGSTIYLVLTFIQFLSGVWFLLSLPREVMLIYMGKHLPATISFGLSFFTAIVSLIMALFAVLKGSKFAFVMTLINALLTILGMVFMRHYLRVVETINYIDPAKVAVKIQWDWLFIFGILAVLLIVYLGWLVKVAHNAFDKDVLN
jgi:hypothetical protein